MKKLMRTTQFDRGGLALALTLAVLVGVVVIHAEAAKPNGGGASGGTKSATPQLFLSSGKASLAAGQTFTVQVRENSGTTSVNAVQANLTYPADKLELVNIDDTNSAFAVKASGSGSNGSLQIARGTTTPVTGNQLVASITFSAKPVRGSASITFQSTSALIESTTNTNILSTVAGATYQFSK